ncbi:MAG: HAMP domain-containing histidine kinase [Nitrospirae bacterium]|nr:HAMP domain-containing histidine kinase [Nitrospirota bacterium]
MEARLSTGIREFVMEREPKADIHAVVSEKIDRYRQLEQILIQQSKMASMGEMVGVIAHQWKQPLNAISVTVQSLKDACRYHELDRQFVEEVTKTVDSQINHMVKTINGFMDYFRPSVGLETFDLIEVIENVFSLLSAGAKHKSYFRITCHPCGRTFSDFSEVVPCEATVITSYKNKVANVLFNIINNSYEAADERKAIGLMRRSEKCVIQIDLYESDGSLKMEITDNCGGIPENIKDRIFDSYYTTKRKQKGTGIGLYMSKMIIRGCLGGEITAANVDDGAKFILFIPSLKG